jgi:sulfatase modifying factor 1
MAIMTCRKTSLLIISILSLIGCDQKEQFLKETMKNMIFVEGGSFDMGDICLKEHGQPCTFANENASFPVHTVTLDGFYISKYKVTYKSYDFYTKIEDLPMLKIDEDWLDKYPKLRGENFPATANWQLSADYCHWLAKESGLPFDLPTEAQWEYAARNRGRDVHYGTNDGQFILGVNVPSYEQQKKYSGFAQGLYAVGQFPATQLGLYDMAGNGQEWMRDWYSKTYYQHSPQINPAGPESGTEKSLRGMPIADSKSDNATPTATTMFRTGREPLMKDNPPGLWSKYHGNFDQATAADKESDPYKIAERGFYPDVTFRCVINAQSLPEKYR